MINILCRCYHSLYVNHRCGGEVKLLSISPTDKPFMVCESCLAHIQAHDEALAARYDLTIDL